MSKTRIADTLRLAIYEAYQGRCFYTGEPVAYIDFEVDHQQCREPGTEQAGNKSEKER